MSRHIALAPHLSIEGLEKRYHAAHEPHERSWWQILRLVARGQTATAIAESTGYTRYWIGQIARRYNGHGPDGMVNRQRTTSWRAPRMLSATQQEELRQALAGPAPEGAKRWKARTVADWMAAKLGRPVATQRGWDYLQRLPDRKHSQQVPRPQHPLADAEQQAEFKKPSSPVKGGSDCLSPRPGRAVGSGGHRRTSDRLETLAATGAGQNRRQLATGRSPRCNTASNVRAGRYLVGFVHPASGRTIFPLATTVSIPLFEVVLAEFTRQVGASPTKQIVLVLDWPGWHTSVRLRVPDHVHLLFLPPYSPELQQAEHLLASRPLTNDAFINQHSATIEDLEDAQFAQCAALQRRPDLIRSTTCFHWWPQRITRRQGPRRN